MQRARCGEDLRGSLRAIRQLRDHHVAERGERLDLRRAHRLGDPPATRRALRVSGAPGAIHLALANTDEVSDSCDRCRRGLEQHDGEMSAGRHVDARLSTHADLNARRIA